MTHKKIIGESMQVSPHFPTQSMGLVPSDSRRDEQTSMRNRGKGKEKPTQMQFQTVATKSEETAENFAECAKSLFGKAITDVVVQKIADLFSKTFDGAIAQAIADYVCSPPTPTLLFHFEKEKAFVLVYKTTAKVFRSCLVIQADSCRAENVRNIRNATQNCLFDVVIIKP